MAGKPATPSMLVDVPRLVTAYFSNRPDTSVPGQRVAFGTSGHRGTAFENSFNEWHVLAISQAICDYRKREGIGGPLFLGIDTHALSMPAFTSALEVLAANGVEVMLAGEGEYTPTPVISHAILTYNRGRGTGLADGIVITPSHNSPDSGGFKYNPSNGGPADWDVTGWIEARANAFLEHGLQCMPSSRTRSGIHGWRGKPLITPMALELIVFILFRNLRVGVPGTLTASEQMIFPNRLDALLFQDSLQ